MRIIFGSLLFVVSDCILKIKIILFLFMSAEVIILLLVLIAGFGSVFFLLLKQSKDKEKDKSQDQALLMLQNQINELAKVMDSKLSESTKMIQAQFGQSAKIVKDVTEKLTKLDETNKQVINFTEQLQNLQQVLTNPKHRGVLGEYYLETLLQNVLPAKNFQMQYKFKDGEIVDAAIFVGDKIIPVDSKFSLENYNRLLEEEDEERRAQLEQQFKRDLKQRIDETAKYIRPQENTFDFAFMFIPAEGIYYDLLVSQVGAIKVSARDLLEYAFAKKVLIVSPNSFYAYLQTVLQGLRALAIEESAKEIRKNVELLQKHLLNYEEYMRKLGNQLSTVVNTYNSGYKEFKKIDKDVMKITGKSGEVEAMTLDKPKIDE